MLDRLPPVLYRALRTTFFLLVDAGAAYFSGIAALLFRFDFSVPVRYIEQWNRYAVLIVALRLLIYVLFRLYQRAWTMAGIPELMAIFSAVTLGSIASIVLIYFVDVQSGFPRSTVAISWLLNLLVVGGVRLLPRIVSDLRAGVMTPLRRTPKAGQLKRTLIVGAGEAGGLVIKEILRHPELGFLPVGVVDDDPRKHGMRLFGVPVRGTLQEIPRYINNLGVRQVIIAMPSASASTLRKVVHLCRETRVQLLMLPGIYELLGERVTVNHLRPVQIEDLLGREPAKVNMEQISAYIRGKRVLVTGAGGSIGSELCRQVAHTGPASLTLVGHGENSIFEIEHELRRTYPDLALVPVIADVRDEARIQEVFETWRPEVVFHAAAHKHVPLMELNPEEAVKTNILGTVNVARAAVEAGAERFVLISTDKAVNPTNVMGATKRVAELAIRNLDGNRTRFMAVRFGNVLGSRGSVVPVFKQQIAAGGPVTVTHPEMKRYFMTIPEAVQLVIQAGALGRGGEVFVLDMGEPVRIVDLAENLIRLSGLEPGRDIEIQFVGPRPGEKLFEELLTAEKGTDSTQHQRLFVARGAAWETDGWDEKFAAFAARFWEMCRGGRERGQERRGGEPGREWVQEHRGEQVQERRRGERTRERVQDLLRQLVPTYHPELAAAQVEAADLATAEVAAAGQSEVDKVAATTDR